MASRGTAVLGSYPLDFFFLGLGGSHKGKLQESRSILVFTFTTNMSK